MDVTAELHLSSVSLGEFVQTRDELIRVVSITGTEAISDLFAFRFMVLVHPEVIAMAEAEGGLEHALLMGEVRFRLGPAGDLRHGIIREVRSSGHRAVGDVAYTQLTVNVVPRAWLLTQRVNSRIFQGKYVDEIVSIVLSESGVRHRWDLRNTYPKRIYCTQYQETDYDFICRLFAEEGIYFYFEWPEEFEGGGRASHKRKPTEADDNEEAARQVLNVAAGLAKEVEGASKKTGDGSVQGGAGLAGGALGMVSDLLDEQHDDEDTSPIVLGSGTAGESGAGDVLVFTDAADGYATSIAADHDDTPLTVHLRGDAAMAGDHNEVEELIAGFRSAPEHAEVRDYDFRKPLLSLEARVGEAIEEEHQPGLPLEIYEHHGQYLTQDVNEEGAQLLLEAHRRNALLGHGRGSCARFAAGHAFELNTARSHAGETALADGRYGVCRVHHEFYNPHVVGDGEGEHDGLIRGVAHAIHEALAAGYQLPEEQLRNTITTLMASSATSRSYKNRFECVAHTIAYRPPRPTRANRHITETATVMGPPGKDIYLDKYGRVKVQFHWDREGEFDARSSCWLRVAQPWAGAGYGFQFFPRCGMEVLVSFIGGDTDRPIVIGALYNGTHATPEPLPERLTRSGIRTQTSPNGGGFNELSFEDAKNYERIYMHAQRNLEQVVNHDQHTTIGHEQRTNIGGDQRSGIEGTQQTNVGGEQNTVVGGHQSTFVGGSRNTRVASNKIDTVEGNANMHVGGASIRSVQMSDVHSIRGPRDIYSISGATLHVGSFAPEENGYATGYVQGSAYLTAKQRVIVRIQEEEEPAKIRLECGTSSIEILPDKIVLHADDIELHGRQSIKEQASKARIVLDDDLLGEGEAIRFKTAEAAIGLSSNVVKIQARGVDITGQEVHFGQSSISTGRCTGPDDEEVDEPPNVKIKFTHLASEEGEPIADTAYRATAGGYTYEGTTDGQGLLEVYMPDDVGLLHVVLFANQSYPDIYPYADGPLHWSIWTLLIEEMPAPDDLKGARVRLTNLGYQPGSQDLWEGGMDDATAEALREFQRDHGIANTGELDHATSDKLEEVYGS